jgi:hypothetical protein
VSLTESWGKSRVSRQLYDAVRDQKEAHLSKRKRLERVESLIIAIFEAPGFSFDRDPSYVHSRMILKGARFTPGVGVERVKKLIMAASVTIRFDAAFAGTLSRYQAFFRRRH